MEGHEIRRRLLAGLLALTPAVAGAGAVIQTTGTDSHASVLYVSDSKVRVESTSSAGSATVFDGDAEELIFINHATRQYQRVGEAQLRTIAERIANAREEMQRRLKHMPDEHRDEMRQRMRKMMPGGGQTQDIRVERGEATTIAGIACQEAVVHLEGEPSHSVCVAPPENLGLSKAAYRTLDAMFAFFGEMTAGLSEGQGELGPRTTSHVMKALQGVPVRSQAVSGGSSWSVTSVRNTRIEPAQFRVPAGYTEVDPTAAR